MVWGTSGTFLVKCKKNPQNPAGKRARHVSRAIGERSDVPRSSRRFEVRSVYFASPGKGLPLSEMADKASKEGGAVVIGESNNDSQPRAEAALARSQAALASNAVHELRELQVEVVDGGQSLLIYGSVSSFYHKQLAQEAVRAACFGVNVINSIRVS